MTKDEADAHVRFAQDIPGYGARVQLLRPWLEYGPDYNDTVADHVHAACTRWRANGTAGTDLIEFHLTQAENAVPDLVRVETFGLHRPGQISTLCRAEGVTVLNEIRQAGRDFYEVQPAPAGSHCAHCATAAGQL